MLSYPVDLVIYNDNNSKRISSFITAVMAYSSDICHSNIGNISGVSKMLSMVDVVHYVPSDLITHKFGHTFSEESMTQ